MHGNSRYKKLSFLLLICLLFAVCERETRRIVVVVSVAGVSAEASSLQAAAEVNGVMARELQDFSADQNPFSLELPEGTAGPVAVEVRARNAQGCMLAEGRGSLTVMGIGRYDLTVPLSAGAAPDCQTSVMLRVGGGTADIRRLSVTSTLDGRPITTRQDFPGDTSTITLSLGAVASGQLSVSIAGSGCKGCVLHRGTAELRVPSYGSFDLAVTLVPLSGSECPPSTGRLLVPRSYHAAVFLPRGRGGGQVLVLGGEGADGSFHENVELYDPLRGTSAAFGRIATRRNEASAILLTSGPNQGKVLHLGGYNPQGQHLKSADLLDPETGSTRPAASMSLAHGGHTATLLFDGRVVVIGGHENLGAQRSVEVYDPVLDQWSPADDAPVSEYRHSATLLPDGRIVVAGGEKSSGGRVATSAVFDPNAPRGKQWSAVNDLAAARFRHIESALPDGQVLIAGGYDTNGTWMNTAEVFDPQARRWTGVPAMSGRRADHAAVRLSDGSVFLTGGRSFFFEMFAADSEIYAPQLGRFTPSSTLSIGRALHTATHLPDDGVLLIGGLVKAGQQNSGDKTDLVELLYPLSCGP